MDENRITMDMLHRGYENNRIKLIINPQLGSGVVFKIGELWFYFDGDDAEFRSLEEYHACFTDEQILHRAFIALEDMRLDFPDEYMYYYYVLNDQ